MPLRVCSSSSVTSSKCLIFFTLWISSFSLLFLLLLSCCACNLLWKKMHVTSERTEFKKVYWWYLLGKTLLLRVYFHWLILTNKCPNNLNGQTFDIWSSVLKLHYTLIKKICGIFWSCCMLTSTIFDYIWYVFPPLVTVMKTPLLEMNVNAFDFTHS